MPGMLSSSAVETVAEWTSTRARYAGPVADDGVEVGAGEPAPLRPAGLVPAGAEHDARGERCANRATGATVSARLELEWRSRPVSARPVAVACTWASTKAGVSSAPSPATTRSAGRRVGGVAQPGDPAVDDVHGPAGPVADGHVGDQEAHAAHAGIDEGAHARRPTGRGRGPGRRAPACSRCRPAWSRPPPSPPRPGPPPRRTWPWRRRPRCPRRPSPAPLRVRRPGRRRRRRSRRPGRPTAAATASGSVASATTTRSARPAARSAAASSSLRTRPVSVRRRRRPRRRPGSGSRTCPAAPRTATERAPARSTTRAVAAGAPQTSRTARATASGRSSGRTAAMERAKRIAVPCGRHLLGAAVPPVEPVGDPQRGEGQRDEGGHPLADGEAERRLRPDGVDDADEHAAGPGDRVLHLAAGPRRCPGRRPGRPRRRRRMRLRQLPERGGVEVEPLDGDAHLVRPDRRVGVQPAGRLRQHVRSGRAPGAPRGPALPFRARRPPVSPVRCRRT